MAAPSGDARSTVPPPKTRNGDAGSAERRPWRVEGERPAPPVPSRAPRSPRRQPSFWALLGFLLLALWVVATSAATVEGATTPS